MSTIFVRQRNRSQPLLRTAEQRLEKALPYLVVLGVGTSGGRRALMMVQRLSELSEAGRIQSAIFYDCNEVTVTHIRRFLGKFLGRSRSGRGMQALFPDYIPVANGFMRDPRRYEEYQGPIERDMDNIVAQVMAQSERCGRAPEVVIEFMGFDGHAILGGHLHQRLVTAFPSAVILPVMMLPRDHVSREWTRRYVWEQYESLLENTQCLVTSQPSSGNSVDDDARLATGLVGLEIADFEDYETTGSPLAATWRRLTPYAGGWLGMATVKRKMPLLRKFKLMRFPPWWLNYAALGPAEELSASLDNAIWSTLDPAAQMVEGADYRNNVPQEMVVSLPVHPESLESIAMSAAEALERSNIFTQFPNMDIAFTAARFTEGLKKEPYIHATRVYPIQGGLGAVADILHPGHSREERTLLEAYETGFGSYYHLEAPGADRAPALPDGAGRDLDGREQNVRYI